MYDFIVLGTLGMSPMHGYRIARVIADVVGPFEAVSWGTLYPVLRRLQTQGFIEIQDAPEGEGRARTVYAITDRGREALHAMLMDTEHRHGRYEKLFGHKVSLFPLLTPEERLYLCNHYAVYAQQHIDHLTRERRDLEERRPEGTEPFLESIFQFMDHRMSFWTHELAWARELARLSAPQEVK
jgi:DNA-binding PadR family transcriptional regulator